MKRKTFIILLVTVVVPGGVVGEVVEVDGVVAGRRQADAVVAV